MNNHNAGLLKLLVVMMIAVMGNIVIGEEISDITSIALIDKKIAARTAERKKLVASNPCVAYRDEDVVGMNIVKTMGRGKGNYYKSSLTLINRTFYCPIHKKPQMCWTPRGEAWRWCDKGQTAFTKWDHLRRQVRESENIIRKIKSIDEELEKLKERKEELKILEKEKRSKAKDRSASVGDDVDKVAEKHIAETGNFATLGIDKDTNAKDLYMIVDLTKTGKKAVSYLDDVQKGGWSDEYKTTKLVMRKIFPGSFEYMPGRKFTLTKPYYIGVFEVTQKQYQMITQTAPSSFKGDLRPVEHVSYIDLRGAKKGLNWPNDDEVDPDSVIGKLRNRIAMRFDLPSVDEWNEAYENGNNDNWSSNQSSGQTHDVGLKAPNGNGMYDMHGNVWEWTCELEDNGKRGVIRGGCWNSDKSFMRSADPIDTRNSKIGFRFVIRVGM